MTDVFGAENIPVLIGFIIFALYAIYAIADNIGWWLDDKNEPGRFHPFRVEFQGLKKLA